MCISCVPHLYGPERVELTHRIGPCPFLLAPPVQISVEIEAIPKQAACLDHEITLVELRAARSSMSRLATEMKVYSSRRYDSKLGLIAILYVSPLSRDKAPQPNAGMCRKRQLCSSTLLGLLKQPRPTRFLSSSLVFGIFSPWKTRGFYGSSPPQEICVFPVRCLQLTAIPDSCEDT